MSEVQLRKAFELFEAGHPAEAEALCRDILKAQPAARGEAPAQVYAFLGTLLAERGALQEAAGCYERAAQLEPEDFRAWAALGELNMRLGRPEAACETLARAVGLAPENLQLRLAHARAAAECGRREVALAGFQAALALDPGSAVAHYGLGYLYQGNGDSEPAIHHYRQALASDPAFASAHNNLGSLLQAEGKLDEAIAAFRAATELRSDYPGACFNLGSALFAAERYGEAEAALRRAISLQPGFAGAHNHLGLVLLRQDREDEARAAFLQCLALDPGNADAHQNLGSILQARDELEGAAEHYRQAVALKPDDAGLRMSLAETLVKMGAGAEALPHVEANLAPNPADARALSLKCAALAVAGEREAEAYLADLEHLIRRWDIEDLGDFGSLADLNAALAKHVASHPTRREDITTVNGLDTNEVLDSDEPAVRLLRAFIEKSAKRYMARLELDGDHPYNRGRPERYRFKCWGVRMWRAGYQVPHIHPNAWLSGVYYVKLPGAVEAEGREQEGWIEFGRGADKLFRHADPRIRRIKPEEGVLLTFPSYFWHRTIPFSSEEERISIAFDLIAED